MTRITRDNVYAHFIDVTLQKTLWQNSTSAGVKVHPQYHPAKTDNCYIVKMAFQIGKIDCFDANPETRTCYQERLHQYFVVNDVVDEKKVPALLSLIGSCAYRLLRDLFHPNLPLTQDYKTLCDKLESHFPPAERFRFHKREQQIDESRITMLPEEPFPYFAIALYVVCIMMPYRRSFYQSTN